MSRFEEGDHVVCPTGDTARVVRETLEGVEVRYDGALVREHATMVIAGKYLRKYVPGLRLPEPVRIGKGEP